LGGLTSVKDLLQSSIQSLRSAHDGFKTKVDEKHPLLFPLKTLSVLAEAMHEAIEEDQPQMEAEGKNSTPGKRGRNAKRRSSSPQPKKAPQPNNYKSRW